MKRMIKRRDFLKVCGMAAAAGVLSACGNKAASTAGSTARSPAIPSGNRIGPLTRRRSRAAAARAAASSGSMVISARSMRRPSW